MEDNGEVFPEASMRATMAKIKAGCKDGDLQKYAINSILPDGNELHSHPARKAHAALSS